MDGRLARIREAVKLHCANDRGRGSGAIPALIQVSGPAMSGWHNGRFPQPPEPT
jgi:hypothetical protein